MNWLYGNSLADWLLAACVVFGTVLRSMRK